MNFNKPIKELNGHTLGEISATVVGRQTKTLQRILDKVRPVLIIHPGLRQRQAQNYLEVKTHCVYQPMFTSKQSSERILRFCEKSDGKSTRLSAKALVLLAIANYGRSEICNQITQLCVKQYMTNPTPARVRRSKVAVHKPVSSEAKTESAQNFVKLPTPAEIVHLPVSNPNPAPVKIKAELPTAFPVEAYLAEKPDEDSNPNVISLIVKPGMVVRLVAM